MNLKKLLGATLVMAATVAGLVGCGAKTAKYQQGIGSVISLAETNGALTQINVTAVSAVFDENGKVVSQGKAEKIIRVDELSTIYGEKICYSEELPYKEISFKE